MRGDRRSSSFRKEKPAGLSRALSWLSVSTLSHQSRRIFHSQSELHAAHTRPAYSHTHLHTADGDGDEDEDNWVYQPQHKIGESGEEVRAWQATWLTFQLPWFRYKTVDGDPPQHIVCFAWLHHNFTQCLEITQWIFVLALHQEATKRLVYLHKQANKQRSGSLSFYGPLVLHLCVLDTSWLTQGVGGREVCTVSGTVSRSKGTLCLAIGKTMAVSPEAVDVTGTGDVTGWWRCKGEVWCQGEGTFVCVGAFAPSDNALSSNFQELLHRQWRHFQILFACHAASVRISFICLSVPLGCCVSR